MNYAKRFYAFPLFIISMSLFCASSLVATRAWGSEGFSYVQTSIAMTDDQTCAYDQLKVSKILLSRTDDYDSMIERPSANSQVLVQVFLDNNCSINQYPFTVLTEITDSQGISKYVFYQQSASNPGEQITIGASWLPDIPGNYTIKAFTIHCPTCTGPAPVYSQSISVLWHSASSFRR